MLDEQVYYDLRAHVGARRMGDYVGNVVRARLQAINLEAGYKAMASDIVRESEVKQWLDSPLEPIIVDNEEEVWQF